MIRVCAIWNGALKVKCRIRATWRHMATGETETGSLSLLMEANALTFCYKRIDLQGGR